MHHQVEPIDGPYKLPFRKHFDFFKQMWRKKRSKPQAQTNNDQDTPGEMIQKFEYNFKQLQFNLTGNDLILSHGFSKEQDGFKLCYFQAPSSCCGDIPTEPCLFRLNQRIYCTIQFFCHQKILHSGSPLKLYFSGICGTATASLAILMKNRGHQVRGSDENIYPPMSLLLMENQIDVAAGFHQSNLHPRPDLVIIGNALSRGNPEVEAVLSKKIPYISASELLKQHFIKDRRSLVVSGTHGKTTTTSLLAWVFECAGLQPGFMIGGVAENFGSGCRDEEGEFFITEGDEYDTAFFDKRSKFLHYLPEQLILNNLEFDHADIFDTLEDIEYSFRMLLRLVPEDGRIVANGDDPAVMRVLEHSFSPITLFGKSNHCDLCLSGHRLEKGGTYFTAIQKDHPEKSFFLALHGEHNVFNALGVLALARHNGIEDEITSNAFASFRSVKRRMELRGQSSDILVYDDFAHHPTAVAETLKTAKGLFPEQRLIAVFEPRSNTSVQNLMQSMLEEALSLADRVLMAKPHRGESIPVKKRLDEGTLTNNLKRHGVTTTIHQNSDGILQTLVEECKPGDVVVIMSNGSFGNLHQRLLQALELLKK